VDASDTGLSSLVIILDNKKGRLTISHRVMGGKAKSLAEFQKLLEKINLDEWDR
jgi:hypothetical protein